MNWREILMSLALLAIAVFLWQLLKEEDPEILIDDEAQEVLPGYYLNDAELTRFNETGNVLYRMKARKIEQDPDTDTLTLEDITIEYHQQAGWLIEADSAVLPANRNTISFSGHVVARQSTDDKDTEADNIQFSSDSLIYNINNQQLSTPDRIEAKKGAQVISAQGMLLDMPNERVQLLSEVKIRYVP